MCQSVYAESMFTEPVVRYTHTDGMVVHAIAGHIVGKYGESIGYASHQHDGRVWWRTHGTEVTRFASTMADALSHMVGAPVAMVDTVSPEEFIAAPDVDYLTAYAHAHHVSHRVRESCSSPDAVGDMASWFYLSGDGMSGYALTESGELVGVFSLVKGRGDGIVRDAVRNGARSLDCFDGYLPALYARHGFVETAREANWTPGEPDVVYMSLPGVEVGGGPAIGPHDDDTPVTVVVPRGILAYFSDLVDIDDDADETWRRMATRDAAADILREALAPDTRQPTYAEMGGTGTWCATGTHARTCTCAVGSGTPTP